MAANGCRHWMRGVLVAALCYCLVGQTMLVQAAQVAVATAGTQMVLCHGNGEPAPGKNRDEAVSNCPCCWLPIPGVALLPGASAEFTTRLAVAAPGYSAFFADITVVKPPPRGASRAPPVFA